MEIDGNRVSDACCTISEEGTITTSVWRKVGSIDLASRNACWKLLGIEREGQEMRKMQQIRSKDIQRDYDIYEQCLWNKANHLQVNSPAIQKKSARCNLPWTCHVPSID